MKKSLFPIFILFVTLACTNNTNQRNIELQREQDSIRIADSIRVADSLNVLSKIAWGDVEFGMSTEEALSTNVFKESRKPYNSYPFQDIRTQLVNIGSLDYTYSKYMYTKADFFKNRLISFELEGHYRTIKDYKDITETVDVLYKQISDKYGEPTIDNYMPSFYQLEAGHFRVFAWGVGDKSIEVTVHKRSNGRECAVWCFIKNSKEYIPVLQYSDSVRKAKEETFVNPF